MSNDKIAIIAWNTSDFYISKLIPKHMDIVFVLENQWWDLHTLDIHDSMTLLQKHIDSLVQQGIKYIILPPVFEIYFRYHSKSDYNHIILPIFETFFKEQVLPFSIVWKLCVVWNPDHSRVIETTLTSLCKSHILTSNQSKNRYFHKDRIIYHYDTTVFGTLYDMWHSRFVNKLIKVVLKKDQRWAPDSIIPMNYGYLKWTRTIHSFTSKKIRFYGKQYIIDAIGKYIWIWSNVIEWNKYNYTLYYTWKPPDPKIYINLGIKKDDFSIVKLDAV